MANATNTLLIGPRNDLVQNRVYALPARLVFVTSSAALEVSSTSGGGFTAVTATTTGTNLGTGFVRCTSGTAVVYCKAY